MISTYNAVYNWLRNAHKKLEGGAFAFKKNCRESTTRDFAKKKCHAIHLDRQLFKSPEVNTKCVKYKLLLIFDDTPMLLLLIKIV